MTKQEAARAHTEALAKSNTKLATMKNVLMDKRVVEQIKMALPKHLTPERMIRISVSAMSRSPALQECEPLSFAKAVIEASELGLEPSGALGHAYLVPFNNRHTKQKECQLQIGYRGLIELAYRSGRLSTISAEVVYETDDFDWQLGLEPVLAHKPNLMRRSTDNIIAAYAVARFKDGGYVSRVLTKSEIDEHRAASKSKDSGPWVTHYAEMAKKTAVRALAKYLSLSPEMTRAAVVDEYREQGIETESFSEALEANAELVDPETGEVTTQ